MLVAQIDALQIEYSAWYTDHETDGLIDAAKELGVSIVAYSPLGKGMLTGAYVHISPLCYIDRSLFSGTPVHRGELKISITDKSQIANDIRGTIPRFQAENFDTNQRIVNEFSKLAQRKGVLPGQLAIAWVIAQGAIPIPGTRSAERVVENTKGGDVDLSEEELREIRKLIEEAKPVGDRYSAHHMSLVGH